MSQDDQAIIPVTDWAVSTDVTPREKLFTLERAMLQLPQEKLKTGRTIGGGMLAQEIFIPKGTTITGQIHKKEHLNIVVSGLIAVATEDGESVIDARIEPVTMISRAGTKRAGTALEDTVWITIHTFDDSMSDDDLVTNNPDVNITLLEG